MYELIGVLCGLAIYNNTIIDISLPLALYKKLLKRYVMTGFCILSSLLILKSSAYLFSNTSMLVVQLAWGRSRKRENLKLTECRRKQFSLIMLTSKSILRDFWHKNVTMRIWISAARSIDCPASSFCITISRQWCLCNSMTWKTLIRIICTIRCCFHGLVPVSLLPLVSMQVMWFVWLSHAVCSYWSVFSTIPDSLRNSLYWCQDSE